MAGSRFQYVKSFETVDRLDPHNWIVISLKCHDLKNLQFIEKSLKPSDENFNNVMSSVASDVMQEFKDISISYFFSSELDFIFNKSTMIYKRRKSKLLTNLCSLTSSTFITIWQQYFTLKLTFLPAFSGTVYTFPNDQLLRQYLTKHQSECHAFNLAHTSHWALIDKANFEPHQAKDMLKNATFSDMNELLFLKCGVNYNNEPDFNKKGTIYLRKKVEVQIKTEKNKIQKRMQSQLVKLCKDFNKDEFWEQNLATNETTKNCSDYNLVKLCEKNGKFLPHAWAVVRIDGKGFSKFCAKHNFQKPNDIRSLKLMNRAAIVVMERFSDIVISYGDSDEYSFIFDRYKTSDYQTNELISSVVSIFTTSFVDQWSNCFSDKPLLISPSFDGRSVIYPTTSNVRDYLSWRQADCHINNMYNTCYWALVEKANYAPNEAEEKLRFTLSLDKKNILFNEFAIKYDDEEAIYRKGSVIYRSVLNEDIHELCTNYIREKSDKLIVEHIDIIGEEFWLAKPYILGHERSVSSSYSEL